jgi:signal transduction histidine kinase
MTTRDVERWRSVSVESLRFFGAISASVTHEIRNKLAVINEKAGLVEDIAAAMRSGRMPDPDRLETQAKKIAEQIRQANRIIQALNRLAHSADEAQATVDVGGLVALVVELYGRKAAMAQTAIRTVDPGGDIPVLTSPFLLANAVGNCLGLAVASVGEERSLTVSVEPTDGGARVRIQGLAPGGEGDGGGLGGAELAPLLETLDGVVAADRATGELVLEIRHAKPRDHGGLS